MNSDSGLTTINTIPNNTAHTGDGFFRFSIDIEDEDTKSKKKTVFRKLCFYFLFQVSQHTLRWIIIYKIVYKDVHK